MEFLVFKKAPDTHGLAARDFKSVVSAETPYGGAELGRGKFGPTGGEAVAVRRAREPYGHRTQSGSTTGGVKGPPSLAAGGISL